MKVLSSTSTDDILTKICALRKFSTRNKVFEVKFEKGFCIFSLKREKDKKRKRHQGREGESDRREGGKD